MTTTEDTDPKDLVHRVQHVRQRWDWDCGISCVLMVLSPEQREHFLKEFQHICHMEGIEKSTWTIDLCYLLKRFEIKHRMYTSLAGVNQDYRRKSYYRNIIDSDRSRVERRFKLASSVGIDVREQLLSEDELLTHLKTAPAILLVDAGLLACDICKHNKLKSEFRSCFGGSYLGHYILVVGRAHGRLLYRDPARAPRLCAAPRAALLRAAAQSGTDDDCILLYTDTPTSAPAPTPTPS